MDQVSVLYSPIYMYLYVACCRYIHSYVNLLTTEILLLLTLFGMGLYFICSVCIEEGTCIHDIVCIDTVPVLQSRSAPKEGILFIQSILRKGSLDVTSIHDTNIFMLL